MRSQSVGGESLSVGGKLRGFEQGEFFERQKSFGLNNGNYSLIEGGEATIPGTLFALKRQRQRLQARHGGHLFDPVDEQCRTRAAKKKYERSWLRLQTEMNRGVDDVQRAISAANTVANFFQMAIGKLASHAGDVVHATDFLHGSGRNGELLAADSEQNYLFGARLAGFIARWKIHQRAPTGAARVIAMTRFSIAA